MIARRLLVELQQLDRKDKLQVIQFLNDELSGDIDKVFEGTRVFKMSPLFRASAEAISMLEQLEDESKDNG
ncbi:MAG: hypothetical protein OXE46_07870 [Chloroflexi bacterium]|nr:hypothetical protein [Chloroflexota bacterium]